MSLHGSLLVLSQPVTEALLDEVALVVESVAHAHAAYSAGRAQCPPRLHMPAGVDSAFILVMPAAVPDTAALGAKLISVYPQNRPRGLPLHRAAVLLFDLETGRPAALLDGEALTAARTAAASTLATQYLARPDATVLALIGAGAQARAHLRLLAAAARGEVPARAGTVWPDPAVRGLREVRVCSRTGGSAMALAGEMAGVADCPVRAMATAREAVEGADIVVTATTATQPVIHRAWLAPGTHLCAVGAFRPDARELDSDTVAAATLVVDAREAALREAGDVLIPLNEGRFDAAHIHAELGELVLGRRLGRTAPDELTVYKSVGLAIQDVTLAAALVTRAIERGAGYMVEF
jgi:alanine dehydrogenase